MRKTPSEAKRARENAQRKARRNRILEKREQSKAARLRALGFATYEDYLNSQLWREIRECVFTLKGSRCVRCGAPANTVHHARYDMDTLRGLSLEYLHPACMSCHRWAEDAPPLAHEVRSKLERANQRLGVPT